MTEAPPPSSLKQLHLSNLNKGQEFMTGQLSHSTFKTPHLNPDMNGWVMSGLDKNVKLQGVDPTSIRAEGDGFWSNHHYYHHHSYSLNQHSQQWLAWHWLGPGDQRDASNTVKSNYHQWLCGKNKSALLQTIAPDCADRGKHTPMQAHPQRNSHTYCTPHTHHCLVSATFSLPPLHGTAIL